MPRKRTSPAHPFTDSARGLRLQRVLAQAGIDSRRHCEQMIEEGRVRVNDVVVTRLPAWVDATQDRIEVDGRPIRRRGTRRGSQHHYIMLNKPMGVVATNDDEFGRTRAIDLVDLPGEKRLFCAGRLEADSTGLLLLTDDGELAHRLTHPRYGIEKTFELAVRGALDAAGVRQLETDIIAQGPRSRKSRRPAAIRLELVRRESQRTHLRMHLGPSGHVPIREVLAGLDYQVKSIRRVQLGPLRLSRLALGEFRPLTQTELVQLRKATGLTSER